MLRYVIARLSNAICAFLTPTLPQRYVYPFRFTSTPILHSKRVLIFAPSFRSGAVINIIYGFSHYFDFMAKADTFRFLNPDLKDGAKTGTGIELILNLDAFALPNFVQHNFSTLVCKHSPLKKQNEQARNATKSTLYRRPSTRNLRMVRLRKKQASTLLRWCAQRNRIRSCD